MQGEWWLSNREQLFKVILYLCRVTTRLLITTGDVVYLMFYLIPCLTTVEEYLCDLNATHAP